MGRRPEPKSEKIARGTYRSDRDKSMTVARADEVPEPPAGLGDAGRQFWANAYAQPWVNLSDQTMVHLIARKLDERQMVVDQFHQAPADYFRQQRTLKEIDRDVASGLDQLLLTPNSRRRAGIETADPSKGEPSKLDLLFAWRDGDITEKEYDQRMEPLKERQAADLKKQGQQEQLKRLDD